MPRYSDNNPHEFVFFNHRRVSSFRFSLFLSLLFCLLTTGTANASEAEEKEPQAVSTQRINAIEANKESDWLVHGYSNREQRHSPLSQVNTKTVAQLGLSWFFDTDYQRGLEATPIVADGVMYVPGNWNIIYALDAKTGELIWRYDPEVPKSWGKMACCDVVSRGVAFWQGKVLAATLDGRLIAIDAASGEKIWEVVTLPKHLDKNYPYTITGAPRVFKGKVIIGNGGAEYGVRGFVSAYDVNTGELVWRFHTVPGNPEDGFESELMANAADTWSGEWWQYGGGGTVWDSIVYDHELDQILLGVGNGSPWDREVRSPGGGDNLYLSSIVALDPDTGAYKWHYQEVPAENWDYTATQHIMLADMNWQGENKKVIWHAPKNGFFFIIDRENGQLLSAEPYTEVNWASHYDMKTGRPVETEIANYQQTGGSDFIQPSSIGAHNWHPMAHNPDTGFVYIPLMRSAFQYQQVDQYQHQAGHWNTGVVDAKPYPGTPAELNQAILNKVTTGHLIAWDPKTQSEQWRVDHSKTWNGGILSTAGDLVFQGTDDGEFRAYHAATGEQLWQFIAQTGIVAAPISYAVDGEQYIAVLAGRGGAFSLIAGNEVPKERPFHSRILVFKLGASQHLPPVVNQVQYPELPDMPVVSDETLASGLDLYHRYCAGCHGFNVTSNGGIPDLKHLPAVFYEKSMFDM
ncbi:MAG: PQQ-dependent dehydrogenase, methanol/ethanol family, partial [Pseudomonadales bacterium]|nr:PQQ-dependent dehydrogenase, methanol/ethanol family [Pseudomonadales bacterium]